MDRIKLTGRVVEKGDVSSEELTIQAEEAESYEARGYIVTEVLSRTRAILLTDQPDGTIEVDRRHDAAGRHAAQGGHMNRGFSGYYVGYVYLSGKRKAIKDWRSIFPEGDHAYARSIDAPDALRAIRKAIAIRAGTELVKVKGGYAFTPTA
jgi:hypothetical protein